MNSKINFTNSIINIQQRTCPVWKVLNLQMPRQFSIHWDFRATVFYPDRLNSRSCLIPNTVYSTLNGYHRRQEFHCTYKTNTILLIFALPRLRSPPLHFNHWHHKLKSKTSKLKWRAFFKCKTQHRHLHVRRVIVVEW